MGPHEHNSSYNFIPFILKLCTCFLHSLQMCMCFWYNPCINFRPSVKIYPGCLVSAIPRTVLSFWNFACDFFMVWGCACGLDIIVRSFFFFFTFCYIVNLVIFHPQYIDSGNLLWVQLLLQFCTNCYETLHFFSIVWRCACAYDIILTFIYLVNFYFLTSDV